MPRKYSMQNRSANVDETRLRIVEATMALHDEKGVLATSMQDIAARANVSLGTVYRHFPTVDDLIPACGGRTFELNPPPTPAVFQPLEGTARIVALIAALYAHYEATEQPHLVGYAEASKLPILQHFMDTGDAYIRSLVGKALEPLTPSEQQMGLALAMSDFFTWHALKRAGFDTEAAAALAGDLIVNQLSREPRAR